MQHGGGAFVIWPRSHKAVHRFFLANPEQIDGSFHGRDDWDGWGTLYTDKQWSAGLDIPEEPMEVLGEAGDVCLWHNFLAHDGSSNLRRNEPRLAAFSRFHMVDMFRGPQMMPPGEDGRVEGWVEEERRAGGPFEPLDSPVRQAEPRYETPSNLFAKWSEETQRAGEGARL